MADIDLHQLANQPGFGAAQKALKDAGHWDEAAAPGMKRFEIIVKARTYLTVSTEVEVTARDRAEAIKAAKVKAVDHGFWEVEDDLEENEITSVEIISIDGEDA